MGVEPEIVITDVAPAQNDCAVVRHHQLVVHSGIHLGEAQRSIGQHTQAALPFRIEQAQIDVGMRIQRKEKFIVTDQQQVIDQQAHPDPALCGQDGPLE